MVYITSYICIERFIKFNSTIFFYVILLSSSLASDNFGFAQIVNVLPAVDWIESDHNKISRLETNYQHQKLSWVMEHILHQGRSKEAKFLLFGLTYYSWNSFAMYALPTIQFCALCRLLSILHTNRALLIWRGWEMIYWFQQCIPSHKAGIRLHILGHFFPNRLISRYKIPYQAGTAEKFQKHKNC